MVPTCGLVRSGARRPWQQRSQRSHVPRESCHCRETITPTKRRGCGGALEALLRNEQPDVTYFGRNGRVCTGFCKMATLPRNRANARSTLNKLLDRSQHKECQPRCVTASRPKSCQKADNDCHNVYAFVFTHPQGTLARPSIRETRTASSSKRPVTSIQPTFPIRRGLISPHCSAEVQPVAEVLKPRAHIAFGPKPKRVAKRIFREAFCLDSADSSNLYA